MMTEVLVDYQVNEKTMALVPAKHERARTLVLETNGEFYVEEPVVSIIEQACLEGGASYEGRKQAVIHRIGVKHKAPIPICPLSGIYAFPTHSIRSFENIWLFYTHVLLFEEFNDGTIPKTMITFSNKESITVPLSHYSVNQQMKRTRQCIGQFSPTSFFTQRGFFT